MESTYTFQEKTIDFNIVYKKRKTLGIYIDVYGNIELRVPKHTQDQQIIAMIEGKWQWIVKKQEEMRQRTKGFKQKTYEDAEEFLFLGKSYPIKVVVDESCQGVSITLREEEESYLEIIVAEHDLEVIRKALTKFYKQQCKKIVESRVRTYQTHFKKKPKSIKISSNKKHWGSCSSLRDITFNWRLAMAPIKVIDYVVVHEMCHMVHMNHDRSFWRLVGKHIPDYEVQQEWLKQSHWKMVV